MKPPELNLEASVYRCALLGGLVESSEVVAWADAWIWQLDEAPDALVEVSLNGSRLNELLTALNQLAEHPVSLEAVRLLFRKMNEYLTHHPAEFRTVTRLLESVGREVVLPVQLAWPLASFDDALSLADQGIFDLREVRQELLAFLSLHGAGPALPPRML